jgi:hypothetical protein
VVLSTVGITPLRTQASLQRAAILNSLSDLNGIRGVINSQVRAATASARNAIQSQVAQLFANGRPTAQQRQDFLASTQGILSATALQLSSLASLLPGGTSSLVPAVQRALIGNQANSLASRIQLATQGGRTSRTAQVLNSAISQAFARATTQRVGDFSSFLRNTAPGNLAVDSNGVTIPLSQFIGTQVVNQLGNTLGALAQSFPTVASTLIASAPSGGDTTTPLPPSVERAFTSAVGLVAFQLRSGLALSPILGSNLTSALQTSLLNTGQDSSSLISALQGLSPTSDTFNNDASTVFSDFFNNIASTVSTSFGLSPTTTPSLSTGTIPGVFGSQFSTVGNGFLNGFGSGFTGFGVAPTDFNTNFGTGFNNLVNSTNTSFGFTMPTTPDTQVITGGGPGIVR